MYRCLYLCPLFNQMNAQSSLKLGRANDYIKEICGNLTFSYVIHKRKYIKLDRIYIINVK